ncbi:4Fe-4S binding protein [Methanosarcinaceae archaeon]|nr:4Fe-4S binding protein [Methanosarcinaceae archaeon]MBQ3620644.1 4Fe-4S binding protein [Methanosarcinaceae archaeon]
MKVNEKCIGCSQCISFCKYGAIQVRGRAQISEELCRNCGICVTYCPTGALQFGDDDPVNLSPGSVSGVKA